MHIYWGIYGTNFSTTRHIRWNLKKLLKSGYHYYRVRPFFWVNRLVKDRQEETTHFMWKTHIRQTFIPFSSYLDILICKDLYHNLCYNYCNSLKPYYVIYFDFWCCIFTKSRWSECTYMWSLGDSTNSRWQIKKEIRNTTTYRSLQIALLKNSICHVFFLPVSVRNQYMVQWERSSVLLELFEILPSVLFGSDLKVTDLLSFK